MQLPPPGWRSAAASLAFGNVKLENDRVTRSLVLAVQRTITPKR
jgi:hypothetical protein